ncbi:hypothetical protein HMPREF9629_00614 [Peptoanaerobacter stomatis]|uniref:Uncharacterized protein n=1 Tax=Peptoanaerobacter stomatis TaxID=796937 RepID=G9X2K7_9FIRM|nr:hypothetical protein [Peptoanaerobacter stomatis]EHL11077.1 hypothetical protein HMPREF9629_00614 [Peptoanaerobacter stomatis]
MKKKICIFLCFVFSFMTTNNANAISSLGELKAFEKFSNEKFEVQEVDEKVEITEQIKDETDIQDPLNIATLYNKKIDMDKIKRIPGTGEYKGYIVLKGYLGEDKVLLAYKGDLKSGSYSTKVVNKKPLNGNDKVTWQYEGKKLISKRKDIYKLLSDITGNDNMDLLREVFGKTFDEYLDEQYIINDAESFLTIYLDYKSGLSKMLRERNTRTLPDVLPD